MCMDKRNEFGEIFVYFSHMKRYLRVFLNIYKFVNNVTLCVFIFIRRGTNIAIEATVRTLTYYITNHTKTLQEAVCIEKKISGNIICE